MRLPGRRMIQLGWGWLIASVLSVPALGMAPDLQVSDLYHTSWTARDGAPTSIREITQTRDGYLWLATAVGLFRFDGVRFERFEGAGDARLLSSNIFCLYAGSSGDLWIGYMFGGVSVIRNGRITNYTERDGLHTATVRVLARDPAGAMWAGTSRGLMRFDGQRWWDIGDEWNGPRSNVASIAVDGAGTLWVVAQEALFYLRRGAHRLERPKIPLASTEQAEVVVSPEGVAWLFDPVAGAFSMSVPDSASSGTPLDWPHLRLEQPDLVNGLLIDRGGGVWRRSAKGLRRFDLQAARKAGVIGADRSARPEIMTSDFLMSAYEDREGNVWFGTAGGLDKFREPQLRRIEFAADGGAVVMSSGDANTMWLGTLSGQLLRFGSGGQLLWESKQFRNITALYRDPSGALWIAGTAGLWRRGPPSDPRITGPFGDPDLLKTEVQSMAMDGTGALWVSVVRAGVFRITEGDRWTLWGGRSDLPAEPATILATDDKGFLWLGYPRNRIVRVEGDSVVTYSEQAGLDLGVVLALDTSKGHVWAGGEGGLAHFDGRGFRSVTGQVVGQPSTGARPFTGVSGIVQTSSGDLWLSTGAGIAHIAAEEVRRVISEPAHPVRYQLMNYLDGIPGAPPQIRPVPSLVQSNDGLLWFSMQNGVVRLDPQRIKRNSLKPNVAIEGITADGVEYETSRDIRLPARTRNLQIAYTALSLSIPERVQFRYRLEGVDASWQDVGTRRVAYYTDLPPGDYRFQVVASNNDNLWNEEGAVIGMAIPPTFVQTRWFVALCVLAGAILVWLLVRLRLRQIIATNRWRLEERLIERERIARELHDTLLQGFQGLILKFQSATERIPVHEPARALMDEALDRADLVLAEGRDRVTDLRTATLAQTDLVKALQRVGDEMMQESSTTFRLTVEKAPRALHPVLLEEVTRIGAEAIINAFNHAGARNIDVHIVFGARNLTLRVRDDGRGFDTVLARARQSEGHWGLAGMRERAARSRIQLDISSRVGEGTTVELQVPARIAYDVMRGVHGWRYWSRLLSQLVRTRKGRE